MPEKLKLHLCRNFSLEMVKKIDLITHKYDSRFLKHLMVSNNVTVTFLCER